VINNSQLITIISIKDSCGSTMIIKWPLRPPNGPPIGAITVIVIMALFARKIL